MRYMLHRPATRAVVQVHGGYGYVDEYPVERPMRDAVSLSARDGGTESLLVAIPW
jgi:alkylation response protein AidB-like acyl-CoA dehydrogenase